MLERLCPRPVLIDAVDQQHVDLVDLQPFEAGLGHGDDLGLGHRRAVAHAAADPGLGADDPVLSLARIFQVVAEDLFAAPVRRRGVEEVDAQLLGPRHGAGESLRRDLEVRIAPVRPGRLARIASGGAIGGDRPVLAHRSDAADADLADFEVGPAQFSVSHRCSSANMARPLHRSLDPFAAGIEYIRYCTGPFACQGRERSSDASVSAGGLKRR